VNRWCLSYHGYEPESEQLREALCTLGNGYFGTRGAAPESAADGVHYPGTYVAGLYNRLCTDVEGREVENESNVNVPNWLPLTFRIDDGPWFSIDEVEVLDYEQTLELQRGVLIRRTRFRDSSGRTTTTAGSPCRSRPRISAFGPRSPTSDPSTWRSTTASGDSTPAARSTSRGDATVSGRSGVSSQMQRPPSATPRVQSSVASTVRTVKVSPPGSG
jgi:hypothetical protein